MLHRRPPVNIASGMPKSIFVLTFKARTLISAWKTLSIPVDRVKFPEWYASRNARYSRGLPNLRSRGPLERSGEPSRSSRMSGSLFKNGL